MPNGDSIAGVGDLNCAWFGLTSRARPEKDDLEAPKGGLRLGMGLGQATRRGGGQK
jgi:hypothetical protein